MSFGEEAARPDPSQDRVVVRAVKVACGDDHRCLFRHLMQAATEIAQSDGPPGRSERFAAVAARFRDLGHGPDREGVGPVVAMGDGAVVPLSDLLAAAWLRERDALPGPGIDHEMVEAARQLLLNLTWHLPGS